MSRRIKEEQESPDISISEKVARLHADGKLTEDTILSAAEQGQNGFVAEALAVRAGVPGAVIHKMRDSRSGKAVTALAWKSGLSARGSMKLQRQVARVPAKAMIHARDVVNYALADSEMDWFVSYFEGSPGNPLPPGERTKASSP